jgi:hypothetical protein
MISVSARRKVKTTTMVFYSNSLSWLIPFGLRLSQWSGWIEIVVVLVCSPVPTGLASHEAMIHHGTATFLDSMGLFVVLMRP